MKKTHNIVFALLILVYVLAVSSLLSRGHDWGDDFASYIMQAKSIVNGTEKDFLEQNSFTITNSSILVGPVAYPWGYPLFLSLYYAVFGLNPLALKIPNLLFFVLFMFVFYKLITKRLSPWDGMLLVSILAFNPALFSFQNQILSDIPFLFFSTLSIILIDRFVCENRQSPASFINNLILGGSIFLAVSIRTTGIILIASLFLCQIIAIHHQWKNIVAHPRILLQFLIPYCVIGVLMFVSSLLLPGGESSYLQSFSSSSYYLLGILKNNLRLYFHLMEGFLATLPSYPTLYGFLLAFLLIGIIARINMDYAFVIYSASMIGLCLVWPSNQGLRFLFPIIPFFIYFSYQGMKIGFSSLSGIYRRAGLSIMHLFWIGMLIIFAANSTKLVQVNLESDRQVNGPFDNYSSDLFEFIRTDTPPSSVIVFFKPRVMRLMTERASILIDTCNHLALGDYIVLLKQGTRTQIPLEQIGSCDLSTVQSFENDNFVIYKINK